MLLSSADTLEPYFVCIANCAAKMPFGIALRSRLGMIGREAEIAMLATTSGVNTHRGAIWALGLLVAGFASRRMDGEDDAKTTTDAAAICRRAARIACTPTVAKISTSHGSTMHARARRQWRTR